LVVNANFEKKLLVIIYVRCWSDIFCAEKNAIEVQPHLIFMVMNCNISCFLLVMYQISSSGWPDIWLFFYYPSKLLNAPDIAAGYLPIHMTWNQQ